MDWVELYRRLSANAFLFDDPRAYASGIADALDAVRRILEWEGLVAAVPESTNLMLPEATVPESGGLSLPTATVAERGDLSRRTASVLALPD